MIICTTCGASIDSIEEVMEQDWILSFFEGEEEHGPVCPSCSELLIYIANDGVYELKNEYRGKIVYHDQLENDYSDDLLSGIVLGFILN